LYFGHNPRRCFEASSSIAKLVSKKQEVVSVVEDAAKNGGDNLMRLLNAGASDISHMIFQISPITTDTDQLFVCCQYEAVSRWALDLLLRRYKATVVADFFHGVSTTSRAASLRGSLFERQVLMYFDDTATDRDLSMHELTSSDQITWTFRARTRRVSFQEPAAIGKIKDAVETSKPLHLVPLDPKFPAVVYHPNEFFTCIQITTNSKHPIAISELRRIQGWLKDSIPPAGLRPDRARPWRFIFIVPSEMASTFTLQELDGKGELEWAGMVDQYVLGLEDGNIFGKRSY
jgi:hypothetical protein